MRINTQILNQRASYSQPVVELIEVKTECGFANSIENVGRDEEVDF